MDIAQAAAKYEPQTQKALEIASRAVKNGYRLLMIERNTRALIRDLKRSDNRK